MAGFACSLYNLQADRRLTPQGNTLTAHKRAGQDDHEGAQELLASVIRKSPDFAAALDAFLSHLLAECGDTTRPTDGVILSWEELSNAGVFGFGIVVVIEDQSVEPVRVQLHLNPQRDAFASGLIQFGCREHSPRPYNSSEHHRLARSILGNRDLAFCWREQFRCSSHGWRRIPRDES